MITLASVDGKRAFRGELEPGSDAFVDADWLVGREGSVVPVTSVAASLGSLAAAAAAAAGASDSVAVAGDGFVARRIRDLLGLGPTSDVADCVVETRADPASLVVSTRRVADLGTVVLAFPPEPPSFRFDLYPDVHVRGLRLVGVELPPDAEAVDFDLAPVDSPVVVRLEEPIPAAAWYRIIA